MGKDTGISWTDHTFNLVWGCVKVSRGCKNCYAEEAATRFGNDVWGADKPRRTFGDKHWYQPRSWNFGASVKGIRKRVFCGSMCDVFEDHPTVNEEREKLWQLIYMTQSNLEWQLLTKRPENIKRFLPPDWGEGWQNVWLGTSVENQEAADQRVPILLDIPARVRFLSCEPLIEEFDLTQWFWQLPDPICSNCPKDADCECGYRTAKENGRPYIGWVIVGGESGSHREDCGVDAISSLAMQCVSSKVPVFVKQDCALKPGQQGRIPDDIWELKEFPS